MRLDVYLTDKGICESRAKAQDAIQEGRVKVNGKIAKKSSMTVNENMQVEIEDAEIAFASRAGFKLYDVLDSFHIDLKDRVCLDIGASTGGFTDVCLQKGASYVYAVDVGKDQLIKRLREDKRVANMEGVNCRYIKADMFPLKPSFLCMDVSFISIKQILPVIAKEFEQIEMVVLVKPQFEAGKENVGKHGIVKSEKVHIEVLKSICEFVSQLGFYVHDLCASSVLGRDGNKEFVMHIKRQECHKVFPFKEIVKNYQVKR